MDGGPVAALAQATLSDVEGLRPPAVSRPPEASTGPLGRLWCRFAAYNTPTLVERQAVPVAPAALKPIMPCEDMPAARPPPALDRRKPAIPGEASAGPGTSASAPSPLAGGALRGGRPTGATARRRGSAAGAIA